MKSSLLAVTLLLIAPLSAQAGQSHDTAGRTISYRTAVEVMERDADNKPLKGTTERVGVTLHEKGPGAGSFSQIRIVSDWERTGPGGVYSGTLYRTFADGDTQEITFEGQFGKGQARGTYTCVGGTGRYTGVSCGGTYESESFKNGMAANRWAGTLAFKE